MLPRSFYFPKSNELAAFGSAGQAPPVDLLTPTRVTATDYGWNSDYGNYAAIGRLRPGVTPAEAQAQLDGISNALVHEAPAGQFEPGLKPPLSTFVQPLKQSITGRATAGLYLLLAAVCSVLLIACINLANAQLARVLSRGREAALRSALGASAGSLIRASVIESLLLALVGGVLGVLLARAILQRFGDVIHVAIPRSANIHLNPAVLTLSVVCTVGATVLFGLLPALHYLRVRPQAILGSAGRATGTEGGTLLRHALIAAQVLACTALLLLTTLFARNLSQLLHGANGFSTGGTIQATVRLQGKSFSDPARAAFQDSMLEHLGNLPSVTSAALVSSILGQGELWADGIRATGAPENQSQLAQNRWISPAYFQTVGQRILAGRSLGAGDRIPVTDGDTPPPANTPPIAAVLSESLAAALWPGQDALGRTFTRHDRTYRVVGIAAGARTNSPHEAPPSMVYLPYWDNPPYQTFFLIHVTGDPAALIPSIRAAIWQQNPSVIIADVRTLDSTLADTLAPERLQTTLLAGFGAVALLLALLGIYGTLNYTIGRRTQEFGIRLALGATRPNIYWITLRDMLLPLAAGLLGGLAVSIAIARIVRSMLDGTGNLGPASTLAVLVLLATAALLATYLPCRRAAHLEPMDALRTE